MKVDPFVEHVTSREYRARKEAMWREIFFNVEVRTIFLRRLKALQESKKRMPPDWFPVVKELVEPCDKRKRGRPKRVHPDAKQFADDQCCYLALNHLVKKKGLSRTSAGKAVGMAMGLTRQAVLDAVDRAGKSYLWKPQV